MDSRNLKINLSYGITKKKNYDLVFVILEALQHLGSSAGALTASKDGSPGPDLALTMALVYIVSVTGRLPTKSLSPLPVSQSKK